MKKYLNICAVVLGFLVLVGCNKKTDSNSTDPTNVTKTYKWADAVKDYPMLSGFPSYDYELENVQYSQLASDMESLSFFDYKCEQKCFTEYKAKMDASKGFTGLMDSEQSAMYRSTDKTLTLSISYSGGNFAANYSKSEN